MADAQSDPIKHSDIAQPGFIDDNFVKEVQHGIEWLEIFEAEIKKTATILSESFKGSRIIATVEDVKKLNAAIEQANQVEAVYSKVQKAKIELTNKQLAQAQLDKQNKRDEINLLKAQIVEMDKTIGSLQRVEAANTRLRLERKKLNTETEEGKNRLAEINKELDKNNQYIIINSDKLKQQKLNVGNYAESIQKAFAGTGILGETINKYLGAITLWADKIESAVKALTAQKEVAEATAIAQKDVGEATKAATAAEVSNAAALEAETAATVETETATKGLGASLKALATNPYVLAIAAIAATTKVIYDNVTALQKNKDELDASIEGIKTWLQYFTLGPKAAQQYAQEVKIATLLLDDLTDEQIKNLTIVGKLRADAAKAREEASEEGKTTRERIELLAQFTDKSQEAFNKEIKIAKSRARILRGLADDAKNILGKEDREKLERPAKEAEAIVQQLEEQKESSIRRGQQQRTTLIKQYNDDILKLAQDAQKQELESIDTYSRYKTEHLQKQLDKDLKLNILETQQALINKKKQQDELGAIETKADGTIIDHTKEFQGELQAIRDSGAAKAKELTQKTHDEIEQFNIDFFDKSVEAEKKFREDLNKLDEAYLNIIRTNKNQERENAIQNTQFTIDNEKDKVDELQKQRDLDITSGKEKYKLSLKDLKQYFDIIDKLEDKYYQQSKEKLQRDAEIAKANEDQKTEDTITAIKEKYDKQQKEDEKAIRDKAANPQDAAKQLAEHNKDLADDEATEIEKTKRNSASAIEGIDTKLKGDLTKNDEDHLKRVKSNQDKETEATKAGIENRKKLLEEEKKIEDEITDGISEGLKKRSELRQALDQRDIDYHKRTLDIEAKLASEGRANVLARELASIDKAEERKIQAQKRAQKEQETVALVKTFTDTLHQALEKDEPFFKAFGEALAATGAVKEVFAKLIAGSAEEGTENTGDASGRGVDGRGGRLWVVHPKERIMTKEQNEKLGGMSNEEVMQNAIAFRDLYRPQFESMNVSSTQVKTSNHDAIMTHTLQAEIRELREEIKNKPVQFIEVKGLKEVIEIVSRNGYSEKIHHKVSGKQPPLRIKL